MAFDPPWYLRNAHLQTFLPLFVTPKSDSFFPEAFYFNDGDLTQIVWNADPDVQTPKRVVVLFHGLGGTINSHYIQGMMRFLSSKGILAVLMHFRSSAIANRLLRSYHAGEIEDAKAFIGHIQQRFAHTSIHAVGYSLGGNMLLKLVADSPDLLNSATVVSAPIDLKACTLHLNKGFSKVYQAYILKDLRRHLAHKLTHIKDTQFGLSSENVKSIRSIYAFDERYTSRVHGFDNAEVYYAQNSAKQFLSQIKTPTLIIHALDDPFMPSDIWEDAKAQVSQSTTLELYEHGGHVGFMEKKEKGIQPWLLERTLDFIENHSAELLSSSEVVT